MFCHKPEVQFTMHTMPSFSAILTIELTLEDNGIYKAVFPNTNENVFTLQRTYIVYRVGYIVVL